MAKDIKSIVTYDRKGFIINGKREYLIGGEFHYFRVPAQLWEDRLKKMKNTGANLISVYIAWNMHEPEEGKQRWSGDYDLDRFLTLCEKYGFYVLIKPGPYICAELDFGGHPDWLIEKIAKGEFRLRTLDEKYLELCKYWYKSCAEQINPHLITNGGNIIAAQIENEYDHLIEYGEEVITVDDAVRYFMFLKEAMEEYGIDVPKFANEAEFLRGRGIIDTRTYYPNIPGLWMNEFERFEEKLLDSKKTQTDSPVMILELQAGWFSQIGQPTYVPGIDVLEGVSKSVFITGASIVNYYMMVGGTTFPYIGGRGDVALGGYGNITSYDFGGAPVGETGELNKEKYHWTKGFIRFFKEFAPIIAESDGKSYAKILSGGENIAVLSENGARPDSTLSESDENFTVYEEGNEQGRFFFVRNVEKEDKHITINIRAELSGREYNVKTTVKASATRMFPMNFSVPSTTVKIQYATSEIWGTHKYPNTTSVLFYGAQDIQGEMCVNVPPEKIEVLQGNISVYEVPGGSMLLYKHDGIGIVKIDKVTAFIMTEDLIGKTEELPEGLLFHNAYYLEEINTQSGLALQMQVKENTKTFIAWYEMGKKATAKKQATINGENINLQLSPCGMYTAAFDTAVFASRPQVNWTSEWKYCADSGPVSPQYDDSSWLCLDKPVSLEEAGLFKHGYYWFRGSFTVKEDVADAAINFVHNDTDRFLLYINGVLVFRTRNKSICMHNITKALKQGENSITVLYANEFHNKSHPHEGAIVKYSGIMHPFEIKGYYKSGEKINVQVEAFRVKYQLEGVDSNYHACEFDDSNWQRVPQTEKMVVSKEMGHVVWFRRHFTYTPGEMFTAPLHFISKGADERFLLYINGRPVAQYDTIGPQEAFYIPEAYLNEGDNVLALVLECPGFFEEIMSGYRRGYLYTPQLKLCYISKKINFVEK